jgi:hypothetical protein
MHQILWIAIAWIGGTCTILGSLMAVGSLLLWLVPVSSARSKKADSPIAAAPGWSRWKLLVVSVAIALTGLSLLILIPFPSPA